MIGLMIALASSSPGFITGNELLALCRRDRRECLRYVEGVSDATDAFQSLDMVPRAYCTPKQVTIGQLGDVVIKYLTDNPAERDQQAASLTWVALTEAFRCQKYTL